MAQAATVNTDELLSQLAASEIDRLLSEADAKEAAAAPAPSAAEPPKVEASNDVTAAVTEPSERTALLEAAGFEKADAPKEQVAPADAPAAAAPAVLDERSALLQAAGFESPTDSAPAANLELPASDHDRVPLLLKPLIWLNLPFEKTPSLVKQMLGRAGIVTLVNALAVLTYVFFFKKH